MSVQSLTATCSSPGSRRTGAEGAKAKPWSVSEPVSFTNSDAHLIRLFLAWVQLLGVAREDLTFRLHIHESADVAAATAYWVKVVGFSPVRFMRPTLKRSSPRGVRRNTGADYHGCLVIKVRRSTQLNRRIAGWWSAMAAELAGDRLSAGSIGNPFRGGVIGSTARFGRVRSGFES